MGQTRRFFPPNFLSRFCENWKVCGLEIMNFMKYFCVISLGYSFLVFLAGFHHHVYIFFILLNHHQGSLWFS